MLDQNLIHGGHQVLTWNVADAVVMIDPAHGRKIAKDKSVDRVDGLVALAMAIGLYNRELAPIEYDFDRALILKKELLGAGVWYVVLLLTSIFKAGSRVVPFQILGVMLLLVAASLEVIVTNLKPCL